MMWLIILTCDLGFALILEIGFSKDYGWAETLYVVIYTKNTKISWVGMGCEGRDCSNVCIALSVLKPIKLQIISPKHTL